MCFKSILAGMLLLVLCLPHKLRAQEITLKEKGFIDVYYVHGDHSWAKIPKEKIIQMNFGNKSSRHYGQDEETRRTMDNFESLIVHYKAWNLMGDLITDPVIAWSANKEYLRGEKHSVSFQKIQKYPDLVKRYEAIRPMRFNAILGLGLNPEDKYKGGAYAWFFVNDVHIILTGSRKSPYNFPTSRFNIADLMLLKTDLPTNTSFSFLTDFKSFGRKVDQGAYMKHINGVKRVAGSYAYNELQKGTVKAIRTSENQNVYISVQWPLKEIDAIWERYEKYERGELSPMQAAEEELAKSGGKPFSGPDEWAEPMEDDLKGIEPMTEYNPYRMYLKKPNGRVLKEFDPQKYQSISKMNNNDSYFLLRSNLSGNGYISRNNSHLTDKRGNILKVDGEQGFSSINVLKNGNISFKRNLSESLYSDKLWLGGSINKGPFSSVSEASAAIKDHIRKVEEERRRKSSGGGVSIGWDTHFNVVQIKEIITDASLKVISSKSVYDIQ